MSPRSPARRAWRRFLQHRLGVASLVLLLLFLAVALLAPVLAAWRGIDSTNADLLARLEPPSARHWLGTDDLGRDVLQRLLEGGRVSMLVALVAAVLSAVIGAVIGVVSGFVGGRADSVTMRVTDMVIALPLLPLLIVLSAIDVTKLGVSPQTAQSEMMSLYRIVIIVSLTGWTGVARLVRAETLSLKARDFVRAARALGASPARLMFRHILPNAAASVIVATTLSIGSIVLMESVLSFLGLGIQPPHASWGNMLTGAQELVWSAPLLAVWPGLAIFLTVIAFNFLGDALQDALDPRAERR